MTPRIKPFCNQHLIRQQQRNRIERLLRDIPQVKRASATFTEQAEREATERATEQ